MAGTWVITDMIIPQVSGQGVAKAIRDQRSDIPVALCSGYSAPSQLMSSEPGLLSVFLQKLFQRKDLLTTVTNLM